MQNEMRDRLVELLEQKMHPYLADDIAYYLIVLPATNHIDDFLYCSHCGAKMKGGADNESNM